VEITTKIAELLLSCKTIAVVGLSRDKNKDSHRVAEFLKECGKKIIPVNPFAKGKEILGETCFGSLGEIPEQVAGEIEVVDVFRPSEEIEGIAIELVKLKKEGKFGKLRVFWMQLGIENEEAKKVCVENGIEVVKNKCVKIELEKLLGTKSN
jgi:predicted CoA-binding protein